jgi:hypothetical protein
MMYAAQQRAQQQTQVQRQPKPYTPRGLPEAKIEKKEPAPPPNKEEEKKK